MAEVIVRPGAEADIQAAALWYEDRRPGLGSEFTLQLDSVLDRIAEHPLQFPEIESGVRRALVQRFPYAIYFLGAACPVVVAVLHQRRHPDTWKQRI